MANMTEMDLAALRAYATDLESFKNRVSKHCDDLETGINSCSKYMRDDNSKRALEKGSQVATEIKACLYPAEMLLEKIYHMIAIIEMLNDYIQ